MKANTRYDAQKWRRMADVMFTLPDTYAHAIMAFCVHATGRNPQWPKGSNKKDLIEAPLFCRDSDLYAISILDALPEMRNEVRDTTPKRGAKHYTQNQRDDSQWL